MWYDSETDHWMIIDTGSMTYPLDPHHNVLSGARLMIWMAALLAWAKPMYLGSKFYPIKPIKPMACDLQIHPLFSLFL